MRSSRACARPSLRPPAAAKRKRLITDADLAAISVTNPTRRLFGKSGPTKLDIAVYYAAVGDFMLPHILSTGRYRCSAARPVRPQDCFFQRHAFTGMPPTIATFETKNSDDETKTYISVEDAKGYLALAQFGVVEFHAWGALRQHLDRPDRIVFDLDPGEGIALARSRRGGRPCPGRTGSVSGLSPSSRRRAARASMSSCRSEAEARLEAGAPGDERDRRRGLRPRRHETFTTVMGKDNRKNRIFIDFHRNARSATAVAAYSLRARTDTAGVDPADWADLESIDAPEDLNYSSLPGLLATSGDPWADIDEYARDLPANRRQKQS